MHPLEVWLYDPHITRLVANLQLITNALDPAYKLKMVRAEGIEPSTIGLSDQSSTTEIHPFKMVGLEGYDPSAYWLKASCSVHLSYSPESGRDEWSRTTNLPVISRTL